MNILSAIVLAGILAACNSPAENLSGSGNGGGEISGEKNVVKAYVTTSDRSHLFTEKDLEFNRPASMSPYIVNLDFESHKTSGQLMLLFFLIITFLADLFSVLASSALGGKALALNPNKTVKGITVGCLLAVVAGIALYWLTPFSILQTAIFAIAIVSACAMGDFVINSVKRSLGARSWEGELYIGRGILERFAPLTFSAPVFYHFTLLFYRYLKPHLPFSPFRRYQLRMCFIPFARIRFIKTIRTNAITSTTATQKPAAA